MDMMISQQLLHLPVLSGLAGFVEAQSRDYQAHKPQSQNRTSSAISYMAASPPGLSRSIRKVIVNGRELDTLIDSRSLTLGAWLHRPMYLILSVTAW